MAFSERIKQLRTAKGLSQKDFGKSLGVSTSSIIAYEKGDKKPSYDMLIRIAEVWAVSIDWLCGINAVAPASGLTTVGEFMLNIVALSNSSIGGRITSSETRAGIDFLRCDFEHENFDLLGSNRATLFLDEYGKILDLWRKGTITDELYSLWISDQLQKYGADPLTM